MKTGSKEASGKTLRELRDKSRQLEANVMTPHARAAIQRMQALATSESMLAINTVLNCSPVAWMAVSERAATDGTTLDEAASAIIEDHFRKRLN